MKHTVKAALLCLAVGAAPAAAFAETAKDVVSKAVTEIFVNGDTDAIDTYFAEDYIQHNPRIQSGRAVIKELFSHAPANFKYEPGMIIGDGDLVAVHARITGFGPKTLVGVDIFRVENGLIAEHWDVLQEEVLETASGEPMFTPMQ
ncbi:nuclear transport factor 2 family protein [Labrenzia sp. OB1]|uniref:nuclear transport factor 2 family protein n=1 Tax=Labrenzia sp. OB1 TaxID=1561204 RepID=UPI000AD58DDC|nr:nuclear transport factor 2 family protein [Labrenzia sp. OB1]